MRKLAIPGTRAHVFEPYDTKNIPHVLEKRAIKDTFEDDLGKHWLAWWRILNDSAGQTGQSRYLGMAAR